MPIFHIILSTDFEWSLKSQIIVLEVIFYPFCPKSVQQHYLQPREQSMTNFYPASRLNIESQVRPIFPTFGIEYGVK